MKRGKLIKIPGGGHVRYVDRLGTDQTIAMCARTSTKRHRDFKAEYAGLLAYLMKNRHTSPFEQASITFEIKLPIFVMRQFVRHRTFRLNEQSARYAPLDADWWTPNPNDIRQQNTAGNKQGSQTVTDGDFMLHQQWFVDQLEKFMTDAHLVYGMALARGIAREQARVILPTAQMTTIMVNVDIHNLMHFLRLRCLPEVKARKLANVTPPAFQADIEPNHAQPEIQQVATAMSEVFARLFPITYNLFTKHRLTMLTLE